MSVRAAVHVHSEWSYDAHWSLQRLGETLSRLRYQVVLMTEHDRNFTEQKWEEYRRACGEASDSSGVLFVPGIEYSSPDNVVHVLVLGDLPFLGENLETERMLEKATAAGGLSVFAHPWRKKAWQRFTPDWEEHLFGIELWNRKSDAIAPGSEATELLDQTGLVPFASLDLHNRRQLFPLAMRLDVEGAVTRESVWEALQAKRCRPEAFGVDASRFVAGIAGSGARAAEGLRRSIARLLRPEKHRDEG